MKWFIVLALMLCSACDNAIAPSGVGRRKVTKMADYDPNAGTDTSQQQYPQDWWLMNQPAAQSGAVNTTSTQQAGSYIGRDGHVYDAAGNDQGPSGQDPTGANKSTGAYNPDRGSYDQIVAPAPSQPGTWGGPVSPYSGSPYPTFTPPPLPDYLQKGFALPSAADLQATPGYMARYQQGLDANQRSAAAKGTLLNGGTQKALTKYGQDYASNEYGNLVNQKLNERQQQSSDYLNLAYGPAWQQNQSAVNQYGQLYKQYADSIANNRNSQNDYWSQQMGLLNAGLDAARSGNPGSTGGA